MRKQLAYLEFAVASNFSFLRGASHPEELMVQAAHAGLAGIGLCDRNSVAGVVRAHLAKREKNLTLRYHPGARLVFADGTPDILAYPRDRAAWGRLTRLLTRGNLRAEKGDCILYCDDLLDHVEGLELVVMEEASSPSLRISLSSPPPLRGRSAPAGRREGGKQQSSAPISTPLPNPPPQGGRGQAEHGEIPSCATSSWREYESKRKLLFHLRTAAPGRVRLAASMLYRGNDRARLARCTAVAREARVPLIAVNDVHYHHPDRRQLADVFTCIREKVTIDRAGRMLAVNAERYLKPPHEMARLFRDAPEAIEETLALSDALLFSLDELKYEYPDEQVEGFASPQEALEHLTWEGAAKRYPEGIDAAVRQSLAHEFALIAQRQYAPYFLTVHDIVRYARSKGILCQGRGSAANSTVCYCLGITAVDPVRSGLLFERFISTERDEPPDIDVDFEHERREEVIQYIYKKYGRERAGIAATVICYRGRSAIREVGMAFGLSEDTIGALTSSIWGGGGGAVSKDNIVRAGLNADSPRMRHITALAKEINGFPRHLSQHVGGFVITRSRLDEVAPIANAAMDERTFVEWDKDDLDALGILKIDVLGLGMLTCIRKAIELVERHYPEALPHLPALPSSPSPLAGEVDAQRATGGGSSASYEQASAPSLTLPRKRGKERPEQGEREHAAASVEGSVQSYLDLTSIPAEDKAVYRMLARADSLGVFQVESRAQMSMLPRLKPQEFYDLVIEVAIVRPGPIQGDMVHPYLRRRQGLEKAEYPQPKLGPPDELKAVLHKTLGVPLFQEQAMKIAIVAGGFTPSEADKLRRAMATFKRTGTIGTFRDKMVGGMVAKGYPREFAERCFGQIEGFGEYGFPESHAASFALLVYASAWLKCRYPDAFAAALLNAQPMGFYAPAQIVRDVREHGVEVRPPDINHSFYDAALEPGPAAAERVHSLHREMTGDILATHAIRLGLREIKGLSEEDAKVIVERRLHFEDASPSSSPPPLWGRDREGGTFQIQSQLFTPLPNPPPQGGREQTEQGGREDTEQGGSESAVPGEKQSSYDSLRDLWLRTGLSPRILERLADADAFGSLGLSRRDALWAVKALGRTGDYEDLPLFRAAAINRQEPDVALTPMPLGEQVVNDYRFLKLSLRAHPSSFLRADLTRRKIIKNEALRQAHNGARVSISGLITVRQRPGTANGVIFMTIEDETAVANVIVWPQIFERFRAVVLGSRYVAVTGRIQAESGVIHVVADHIDDLTPMVARLADGGAADDLDVQARATRHAVAKKRSCQSLLSSPGLSR